MHFDQIFSLTLGQKNHFNEMYWSNVTCFSCPKPLVKMAIPFGKCEHLGQVGLLNSHVFLKRMNKKQQNLAQYPKTQNPNQRFEKNKYSWHGEHKKTQT
jgi:hypothetical protein